MRWETPISARQAGEKKLSAWLVLGVGVLDVSEAVIGPNQVRKANRLVVGLVLVGAQFGARLHVVPDKLPSDAALVRRSGGQGPSTAPLMLTHSDDGHSVAGLVLGQAINAFFSPVRRAHVAAHMHAIPLDRAIELQVVAFGVDGFAELVQQDEAVCS